MVVKNFFEYFYEKDARTEDQFDSKQQFKCVFNRHFAVLASKSNL